MNSSLLFSILFLGCPDPPSDIPGNAPAGTEAAPMEQQQPSGPITQEGAVRERGKPLNQHPEMTGGFPATDGKIIQGSIIIKINDSGNGDPPVRYTQDQLAAQDHVKLSGTVSCTGAGCTDPMVLRVVPFFEQKPGEKPKDKQLGGILTKKKLDAVGSYDLLVPKGKDAVVLELLVDSNGDGIPSVGERIAVLERGGQILLSSNSTGLDLDASDKEIEGPMGGPSSPDEPPLISR